MVVVEAPCVFPLTIRGDLQALAATCAQSFCACLAKKENRMVIGRRGRPVTATVVRPQKQSD